MPSAKTPGATRAGSELHLQAAWAEHDATELVASYEGPDLHLLVDQVGPAGRCTGRRAVIKRAAAVPQGDADNFYTQKQLLPENLKVREGYACVSCFALICVL